MENLKYQVKKRGDEKASQKRNKKVQKKVPITWMKRRPMWNNRGLNTWQHYSQVRVTMLPLTTSIVFLDFHDNISTN